MNRWKKHFDKLYNSQNPVDNALLTELPQRNEHEHTDKFLPKEVKSAIRSPKQKKSPGIDGITAEIIQAAGETLVEMIHDFCNTTFTEKSVQKTEEKL